MNEHLAAWQIAEFILGGLDEDEFEEGFALGSLASRDPHDARQPAHALTAYVDVPIDFPCVALEFLLAGKYNAENREAPTLGVGIAAWDISLSLF